METLFTFLLDHFTVLAGAILLTSFGGYIAWRNGRKTRMANAALIFRNAIEPNKFDGLRGHILHGALIQTFFEINKTVHEFRLHINIIDRMRLDHAWFEYHGGDEECPDFL